MSMSLQVRRGHRATLPDLREGELGFTTDTHEVFIGTETATNVQVGTSGEIDTKVAAAQAAAEATAAADATAKVAAHEAAATAHSVSQVTDAVATAYLSTNYYDKTASDSRYMPAGMSPIVAAIIFGG